MLIINNELSVSDALFIIWFDLVRSGAEYSSAIVELNGY